MEEQDNFDKYSENNSDNEEDSENNERNEIRIDNNPDKVDFSKIQKKIKKNPWVGISVVLGIIVIILLIMNFRGGITGGIVGVGEDDIGNKVVDFINVNLIPPGEGEAVLNSVSEKYGLYEVLVNFQGREIPSYATKDGDFFVQALLPLNPDDLLQQAQQTQPLQTGQESAEDYSEEDLGKIKEFSECLKEANMLVYGAGWCPYCQNLIKYFGGEEVIAPIYIECSDAERNPTENEELCEKEEITGFPTIKINGEVYEGARTFEGFSEATECLVPDLQII